MIQWTNISRQPGEKWRRFSVGPCFLPFHSAAPVGNPHGIGSLGHVWRLLCFIQAERSACSRPLNSINKCRCSIKPNPLLNPNMVFELASLPRTARSLGGADRPSTASLPQGGRPAADRRGGCAARMPATTVHRWPPVLHNEGRGEGRAASPVLECMG